MDLLISIFFLGQAGSEKSKTNLQGLQRRAETKMRLWRPRIGVAYFTNPDDHEHRSVSTFVKSTFQSTNENR